MTFFCQNYKKKKGKQLENVLIFIICLFSPITFKKKKSLTSAGDNTRMFCSCSNNRFRPTVRSVYHQFHASQSQTAKTNRADLTLCFRCAAAFSPPDDEDEDDGDVRGGKSLPLPRPASWVKATPRLSAPISWTEATVVSSAPFYR